mgnify:FL=1
MKLKLSNTCIQKWMRKIFHSLVSTVPIFFDWVEKDVASHYGFQMSSFRINPGDRLGQDLERKLVEYLRSEERNGTQLEIGRAHV